jgi:ATP-dependent protease ClpP protease subunit
MYSHCYIICNLLYSFYNYSILLDDNIKNTKLILKKIKEILKTKSKMTNEYINNIDKKFMIIDANKAKELGLCHEIIYI